MSTYYSVLAENQDQLLRFCAPANLPPLDPEAISRHKADASWMLVDESGQVTARCSLWQQAAPTLPGRRPGLIGHYAACDPHAAGHLLDLACSQLAAQGCNLAIGPIDGNTWQQYRLVTEQGVEPRFFLEPDNPTDWPRHFTGRQFQVLAQYFSTIRTDLAQSDPRLTKVAQRAAARGVQIRPLDANRFDEELRRLYHLALTSFSQNFLYTPIGEADFMALYQPLQPYIRPELILVAEYKNQPIGFIFALPDLLQAQRGEQIDAIIIKTVAVHPDHQTGGLGSLLVARCQETAHRLGYRRAIHAPMHEQNDSRKISRHNGTQTIRRYALFARVL